MRDKPGTSHFNYTAFRSVSSFVRQSGILFARDAAQRAEVEGRRFELPWEVWEEMRVNLKAARRIDVIQAEEYIFAPSKAALVREAGGEAED